VRVVGVQVRDQDDVCIGSTSRGNRTPDSTKMAQPSGQNWVQHHGSAAILPSCRAVAPPGQCASHGMPPEPSGSLLRGSQSAFVAGTKVLAIRLLLVTACRSDQSGGCPPLSCCDRRRGQECAMLPRAVHQAYRLSSVDMS